ncbi:MAG TPA: gliding motility-associated C-terminal domain-containing protein [Mucilaginibacter sp.]
MTDNKLISLFSILILFFCKAGAAFAQAPNPPSINYRTPPIYHVNTTIAPLVPANPGGTVPANVYGLVTTVAGSGSPGNVNGLAATANFDRPVGVVFDGAGNLFVSEFKNNDIRKIDLAGVVSLFAGNGTNGSSNGTGNTASFSSPYQVYPDASGNIYVADQGNMYIRKIMPSGVVSTFAGSGFQGSVDGALLSASFDDPTGIAVDGAGNIYVTDRGDSKIRKIDIITGQVTTLGTFGGGNPAYNTGLYYLAIDASGNLYFVDSNQVKEMTPGGTVKVIAGSGVASFADGTGLSAEFNGLVGIAVDALGNIYVGDAGNNLIRKITPSGAVSTLAGTGGQGAVNAIGSTASFFYPTGVTVDNTGAYLYIADAGNHLIRRISLTGYSIDKSLPTGLAFDPTTGIISGTPAVVSPATIYTITAYNIGGSSTTTISIEVDGITIAFAPIPAKARCDADFDPGATANGPITYTSSNTTVAAIVSGKVHITGSGTSVITASDGTSTATQTLTVNAALTPTITVSPAAIDTCQGLPVIYTAAITNGGTNPVYQWQVNGQNSGTNSATFAGNNLNNNDKITCILTSNALCTTSASAVSNVATYTIDVPVSASVSITSTAMGPICAGTEVAFTAKAVNPGNNPTYRWQVNGLDAGGNSPVFSSSSLADGDFVTCILMSNGKCLIDPVAISNIITVKVTPLSGCLIIIPNTFTPNGDGINDLWNITDLQDFPDCRITVFNRYGGVVYNSIGYPKPWNGTYNGSTLPAGTYYYIIDLKNGRKKLTGPVTILR